MDLSNTNTVGTAPDLEETVESSPDVAPDGSILSTESEDGEDRESHEEKSLLRRFLPFF